MVINFLFFLKKRNGVMIFKVKKRKCLFCNKNVHLV